MKKKKIIIVAVVIALLAGGWYGYSEYNRKVKDLKKVSADHHTDAVNLIAEFEKDEQSANQKFLGSIIEVKGNVRSVDKDESGHLTVILGEEGSMSAVRVSMDSTHQHEISDNLPSTVVTVKGACTGFNKDELLGSDVILNRGVLSKN